MNYRLTLGLLVAAAVLGLVVLLAQPPAPDDGQPAPTPIASFLSSEATRLQVRSEGVVVLVERDADGHWQLKQPEAGAADESRLDSVLTELGYLTPIRSIEAVTDLGQYGLAVPGIQVQVTLRTDRTFDLLVGDRTPDGSAYYVKLPESSTVYLVSSYVGSDLEQLLEDPPKAPPTPTATMAVTPESFSTPIGGGTDPAGTPTATPTPVPAPAWTPSASTPTPPASGS